MTSRPGTRQLGRAHDWKLVADSGQRLFFPAEMPAKISDQNLCYGQFS